MSKSMKTKKGSGPTVKPTTPRQRAAMLKQVTETWDAHPEWGVGKLLSSAASIARGELRINPAYVTDKEILSGLRALIPDPEELAP